MHADRANRLQATNDREGESVCVQSASRFKALLLISPKSFPFLTFSPLFLRGVRLVVKRLLVLDRLSFIVILVKDFLACLVLELLAIILIPDLSRGRQQRFNGVTTNGVIAM